jgi:hypothetical protein
VDFFIFCSPHSPLDWKRDDWGVHHRNADYQGEPDVLSYLSLQFPDFLVQGFEREGGREERDRDRGRGGGEGEREKEERGETSATILNGLNVSPVAHYIVTFHYNHICLSNIPCKI